MKQVRGFTLIELMIVVVILAILASLAFSAYTKQVRKSRRADAKQALTELSLRQEKWRSNHAAYLGTDSIAGDKTSFGTLPTSSYYTITFTSIASPTNYVAQAAPPAGSDQAKDTCGTLVWTMASGAVTKTPATQGCW